MIFIMSSRQLVQIRDAGDGLLSLRANHFPIWVRVDPGWAALTMVHL